MLFRSEGKVERSTYNQELQILVQRIEKAQQVETSISEDVYKRQSL